MNKATIRKLEIACAKTEAIQVSIDKDKYRPIYERVAEAKKQLLDALRLSQENTNHG